MMKRSLKKKIPLPTIILIAVIMAASTLATYILSSGAFEEDAVRAIGMVAHNKAELVDVWVEDAVGMMNIAAGRTVFENVLINNTEENRDKANSELTEQNRILGIL